ncbi:MAG TPA: hypothetical protein VK961_00410, partial [Chthoniobacter sp.]|nr:hypothetical protein [Chthoniobacter sp.]
TMHFGNEDKTAVIDFAEDRSSFSGTQFRGGVISLTPRAPDRVVGEKKPLVEFFAGTKWYWEGSKQHVLEIRKGGSLHLDYWTLPTVWKVTGPEQVSFTMHFKNGETKTAVVDFNEDRSAFSGVQFRGGVISRTPRAP